MIKKLTGLIEDFFRGYSIQKNITEAYLRRRDYFETVKHPFGDYCVVFIDSVKSVNKEIQREKRTSLENFGSRVYRVSHPVLTKETVKEILTHRNPIMRVG